MEAKNKQHGKISVYFSEACQKSYQWMYFKSAHASLALPFPLYHIIYTYGLY